MKKINIQPDIDLQNSREYMGAYNSRDFYKGTSFKMAGEWMTNIHYFNDEYIIDFVAFEGALLSCTRSHTSSSLNMPELVWEEDKIIGIKPNLFWAFVMAGVEGPTGKVWVPEINNGILSWKESNTPPSSTSISDLKGPAGDSIKSVNISDAEGHLELTMESSKVITSTGSVLPRFNAGTIETVEWDQNPSLVIDKTNAPREWALNVKVPKGKPATVTVVSEVEKLAPDAQPYVTDLNPDISDANLKFGIPQGEKGDPGDENIAIGCQSDFPNNEPEHDKIWYDPCDESMDEYSVQDFLYNSYIAVGGTLTQEQFETAWKSFPNTSGFEIRFANSFEELGDPTVDKLGKLYMIPATSTVLHDLFEEYIVVHSPSTTEDVYMWEKWGSGQITVDLKDYYTKSEMDQQIQKLENKIEEVSSTIWNDVNN